MALDSFSLVLGAVRHVPACRNLVSRLPILGGIRSVGGIGSVGVSCKMRKRNLSSQRRRQQAKKVSSKHLPLNMKFQPPDNENEEVQTVTEDGTIDVSLDTLPSSTADANFITKADDTVTTSEKKIMLTVEGQQFRNVRLEDLMGMIRNAEKNIILLNQARVRAFKDTESILSEKEALQAKINILEVKLAETEEKIRVAALEKLKVEILENQLEKLRSEISSGNSTEGGNIGSSGKVEKLGPCLEKTNASEVYSSKSGQDTEQLQKRIKMLEGHLHMSDKEIQSQVQLYQESVKEFQSTLKKLEEESRRKAHGELVDDMPWEFWSRLLLTIDGWLLEKKLSSADAKLLREMARKRDGQICNTYLASRGKNDREALGMFLKLISLPTRPGLNIVHIAVEMAPVAKVGGLGDVVSGLSKALQRKGHLVEIILPKYDCMQYERITDLKALDADIQSYFDGQLFKNKIWVGIVEGLPVYFIEPHHPARFFWRGQFYGERDDFKRFSFFSRAALEFLHQAAKRPDIIHCHDWQTAFIAPLYWEIYTARGLNSARICFTCHNFEYQGTTAASELSSCGLDVHRLKRPDRMQDNLAHDKVNPTKGAIVFSNIVTTVSPTYAQEVSTAEGGRGLHATLNHHAKKFVGILNGIDTDTWNPSTDAFLKFQYSVDDLQGKAENKNDLRKLLQLSSSDAFQPLVGCITRLVPQKGVHLIRHAIYRTLQLGGQFVLLGSSPVPHIQREFENIAKQFQSHSHVRLLLKYDEALSHSIYAASDMFIVPSMFEPCGLTQMIAMRYGSVPIVRRTGGLNDTVFDVDDDTIPFEYRNGFTFLMPNEEDLNGAMERAFDCYKNRRDIWQQLVRKDMRIDFSWNSSAAQYEELYEKAVARAMAATPV